MAQNSFISVKNYKYDNTLSYESSKSSDQESEGSEDRNRSESKTMSQNAKVIQTKSNPKEDFMSDSRASDELYLECESEEEISQDQPLKLVDYVRIYEGSREYFTPVLKKSQSISNMTNIGSSYENRLKSYRKVEEMKKGKSSSKVQKFDLDEQFQGRSDSESGMYEDFENKIKLKNGHRSKSGQFVDPELAVLTRPVSMPNFMAKNLIKDERSQELEEEELKRNGELSEEMYSPNVSEVASEVNSEVESRLIEYHESKKELMRSSKEHIDGENGSINGEGMENIHPEDEIDEMFYNVINSNHEADFRFRPEALDPYVKMPQEVLKKKGTGSSKSKNKKSSSRSSSSSSRSSKLSSSKEKELEMSSTESEQNAKVPEPETKPSGKKDTKESETTLKIQEGETSKKGKDYDHKKGKEEKSKKKEEEKIKKSKEVNKEAKGQELEKGVQVKEKNKKEEIEESEMKDIRLSDSDTDVEKEKEKVRRLFEATKDESPNEYLSEGESTRSGKGSKVKEEKKSKKYKHHKSESESEEDEEKVAKSEKKAEKKPEKEDKKLQEKANKIKKESSALSDKSETTDKSEKGDKSSKDKDKKSEKMMKKFPWKSTDYDTIFNALGDCFSSGIIENDSKPIILPRKGFYTIFFRNSKYPYESNLYLFRIGFKYMLINESRNQSFNIDDVVDYGNFRLKLLGNVSLSPNVTKMALIYSNIDRQTLDFTLTPSTIDSKPKIVYKLFYSGPLVPVEMPLKFKRRLRVLSLDNSENLGTSVIGALYLLEKKLSELKKKKVNLADYFDYVCGTGAGALIALLLLKGYSMKDLRTKWNLIVSGLFKWVYSLPSGIIFDYYYIEEFKKNFIKILGTDFLCSKTSPLCMVTSTNVRSNPYELYLFRNYGTSKFGSIDGTSYAPLWLAGWAACALPTYVRGPSNSHLNNIGYNMINKVHLVDGCLVSSSPSLISLQELTNIYNINLRSLVKDNMDLFLSIGTSKSESDSGSISSSTWQILLNCKNLMYNTQVQHLHVKSLFDEYENKYHRIQLPIYPGCKHGKTSKQDVDAVLTSTIQYISRHDNQRIEQIVNILNH